MGLGVIEGDQQKPEGGADENVEAQSVHGR